MPELPEVETIVRGLRPALIGRRILDVRLGKTDFIDDPVVLAESLRGCRVLAVERVGKFISVKLLGEAVTHPEIRFEWFINLGMTGQLMMRQPADPVIP